MCYVLYMYDGAWCVECVVLGGTIGAIHATALYDTRFYYTPLDGGRAGGLLSLL